MRNPRINILAMLLVALTFTSCNLDEVDGITIGYTLYANQSLSETLELRKLISQTLNKDEKALAKLNVFWCGGGAGCYDHGVIVTDIIDRLGEKEFMTMVEKLERDELIGLEGTINTGLAYSLNHGSGKSKPPRIDNAFPELSKLLKSKMENE